jgi:hypothetical protein
VSFAEAAGRVRAVAVPIDHAADGGNGAGPNRAGTKGSRRKVAAAR